jgi:prevent-host-death family protein
VDVVDLHEAETQLFRLLDRVARGEEIVLARNGVPVARLLPVRPAARRPGTLKSRITIGPDFDDPLPPDVVWPLGIDP